jgi:hypothetical protein
VQSIKDDSDGGSGTNELQQTERERRSATPASVGRGNFPTQAEEEVQILQLLQKRVSAISSKANRVAELDERKLILEEATNEREG